ILRSSSMAPLPYIIGSGLLYYSQQNEAKKAEVLPRLQAEIDNQYQGLYMPLEKEMLIAQLNLYAAKAGKDQLSALIQKLYEENNNDFTAYVNQIWDQSMFTSK